MIDVGFLLYCLRHIPAGSSLTDYQFLLKDNICLECAKSVTNANVQKK